MPRDEWAREKRRIDSHRRQARRYYPSKRSKPKKMKTPNPRTIPAGTFVRIRKVKDAESIPFKEYKTRVSVRFRKFVAATQKALLIEHQGYLIWVAKSRLIINR